MESGNEVTVGEAARIRTVPERVQRCSTSYRAMAHGVRGRWHGPTRRESGVGGGNLETHPKGARHNIYRVPGGLVALCAKCDAMLC